MRSSFGKVFMGAAGTDTDTGPSDDQFNRVSFLSHFEGSNNGVNNAFDDGSASNHTITANGNVTQGSFGPFARPDGEWAISYNDGYVRFPDSADWTLGDTFTLEAFIFPTKLLGYNNIMNHGNWYFTVLANGALQVYGMGGDGDSTSGVVALNTWSHVAFSVSSGTGTFYVNGVARGTTSSNNIGDGSGEFYCGKQGVNYWPFYGVQSNYRVVKGTAVYTSNFTVPTTKLTAITNTKLLTGQSNRFVDNSASGHVAEVGGTIPAVTAFGPFLTSKVYNPAVNGASGYFDYSASTYLSAADSADWDFGSDNYTVEFWMYVTRSGVIQGIFSHWGDFNGSNIAWSFEINSSNRLAFLFKAGGITAVTISSSTGDYLNQWVHVAAVRNSNVHTVYLNGVSKATTTNSSAINNCTDVLRVGAYQADYGFDGYICDARIVKGTAVYTGNFTPPTAPLTAITNTKLLLNMKDGQAIDSAAQNNLKLYGNANTSTDQAKFGDTSLHLDGTGDYFEVPNPTSLAFGTGNFTLECWVYMAVDNTNKAIVETRASDLSANGFVFAIDASGGRKLMVYSNAKLFTTSNAISLNTWTHIAISRSGTTLKCFINGTQGASVTNSQDYTNTLVRVGRGIYASSDFNGYIDDLRFSNMARYTANFTAPTAAFADKGQ